MSGEAFKLLISHFNIPPSFVSAVSHHFLPTGRNSIFQHTLGPLDASEIWYLLPVRIQVRCNDLRRGHTNSPAGSSQMDPFHYLHLQDAGVDIRGSQIAVFFRLCQDRRSSTLIAVNFMDGRWNKPAVEPKRRIKETLELSRCRKAQDDFFPHIVFFSSVLRWWINALTSVHEQLLACVSLKSHKWTLYSDTTNRRSICKKRSIPSPKDGAQIITRAGCCIR